MAAKKSTDVMIAGKVYTLSGYEEEGYLQRVAAYINAKISEITERDEFRRIPNEMKSILIELNIADDYFKARVQFEGMEENYKKAEKELFELKHELVDTRMKVEELLEKLDHERQEKNKKTELEQALEENYKKLEEKYELLLQNAKVADEKNRQFEEMLRLSEQEKRELEAVNRELRLNKEKLETTLADALLGAMQEDKEKVAGSQIASPSFGHTLKTTGLSEELTELLAEAENDDMKSEEPSIPPASAMETASVMPELSKEELTELLAPSAVETDLEEQELSKEDWKELLTPPDAETLEEKEAALITEIMNENNPELQELARQIMEIERQEWEEKSKNKGKH